MEMVLFFVLAVVAVGAGVGVVAQRSATRSALFLLLNFCCLAGLYLLLNAQFVAMAQVVVYAGAIVVLFLFVVLLLGVERVEEVRDVRRYQAIAGVLLGALLLAGFVWALLLTFGGAGLPSAGGGLLAQPPATDNVRLIGQALITAYAIPLEMAGIVLLIAIIGTLVLAKKRFEG